MGGGGVGDEDEDEDSDDDGDGDGDDVAWPFALADAVKRACDRSVWQLRYAQPHPLSATPHEP